MIKQFQKPKTKFIPGKHWSPVKAHSESYENRIRAVESDLSDFTESLGELTKNQLSN